MKYRKGQLEDTDRLRELAIISWSQYQNSLEPKEWKNLLLKLSDKRTFYELVKTSDSIVCGNVSKDIIGMAFLVPQGTPTEIYDKDWAYIRFVSVHP